MEFYHTVSNWKQWNSTVRYLVKTMGFYRTVSRFITIHTCSAAEEEVPFWYRDLLSIPHDLYTHHEGEHKLVDLKQTSVRTKCTSCKMHSCNIYYFILKRSRDFLLCNKKETNCVLFTVNTWLLPRTRVRAYYFYILGNQTTSCQYKLSKKTSAAHYRSWRVRIEIKYLYTWFIVE